MRTLTADQTRYIKLRIREVIQGVQNGSPPLDPVDELYALFDTTDAEAGTIAENQRVKYVAALRAQQSKLDEASTVNQGNIARETE